MAMNRRTWLISLGLAGLFAAGAVTGVLATAAFVHHKLRALHHAGPHAVNALAMKWLDWELDLRPDQEAAIETIVQEAHLQLFKFKTEHNEELRAMALPTLERIDAVLTPAQAERWRHTRARIVQHFEAAGHEPASH